MSIVHIQIPFRLPVRDYPSTGFAMAAELEAVAGCSGCFCFDGKIWEMNGEIGRSKSFLTGPL